MNSVNFIKLEIENFKSYSGIHTIGPFYRFTSIIGPNGSGKSNIMDAVTFLFNSPINYLRVKSLKDFISDGKTEMLVRGYIYDHVFERSLIIKDDKEENRNNTKSNIISIYKHNNLKISQKEYNNVLESLNLMSKIRNYSIYQGDIIKSEVNFMHMVEFVSGSSTFIEDYNELEERLRNSNKQLNLLFEKRKDFLQILREENENKEKENNFKKLIDEKDRIQANIYKLQLNNKKQEIENSKNLLNSLEVRRNSLISLSNAALIENLRKDASKIQKEFFEKESQLQYLKGTQAKDPGFKSSAENESDTFNTVKNDKNKIKEKIIERLRNPSLRKLFSNPGAFDFFINSANQDLQISQEEEHINRLKFLLNSIFTETENYRRAFSEKEVEFKSAVKEFEKQLNDLTLSNFEKINKREALESSARQHSSKISKVIAEKTLKERDLNLKNDRLKSIDNEVFNLASKMESKIAQYDRILTDESSKTNELNQITGEILLQKAKQNDQIRRSSTNAIINNLKTMFSGVIGKVIDFIRPTQKKYEKAIGVLLSSYDQAVIVDNEIVALECIKYLKESKTCKLVFLPLNKLKRTNNSNINEEWKDFKAKNCISFEEKYTTLVDFLFKDSLIVPNVKMAKEILYEKHYKFNIITLEGILFSPMGLITGGKDNQNKFEENVFDSLIFKRKNILNDLKAIKDRKDAFVDVQIVKDKINNLLQEKSKINESISNINMLAIAKNGETTFITYDEEISFLKEKLNGLNDELRILNDDLTEFEIAKNQIKEKIKEIEIRIMANIMQEKGFETVNEFKDSLKLFSSLIDEKIRLEIIFEEYKQLFEEINERRNDLPTVDSSTIKNIENELKELQNQLEIVKNNLKNEYSSVEGLSDNKRELDRQILSTKVLLNRLEDDFKDIERAAEVECDLANQEGVSEDLNKLFSLMKEINERLEKNMPSSGLSDSNIQTKFRKINHEYENLKSAVYEIKQQFNEVKKARLERFLSCYNVLASKIAEVYQNLTGSEGNAYIVYEGDPFVNGLKYYLMPPGKRFIEFLDLSGGEKSMAMLSFIFALNSFKKAPFFIFDEVDSALDNINIDRLSKFLKESNEQFIVISLKSQLYQNSDALIGVYKSPSENISKILTLKLD